MISQRIAVLVLGTTVVIGAGGTAWAQAPETVKAQITVGGGFLPQYEGSKDQRALPFVSGRIAYDQRYLALDGLTLRANVFNMPAFEAGPIVAYNFGRGTDIRNQAVKRLGKIDGAVEAGAFAAYSFRNVVTSGDRIRLSVQGLQDISGTHEGWQIRPALGYSTAVTSRLSIGVEVSATVVSRDYAKTFFGVSAAGAAASGLRAFDAKGGVKDVGIGLQAGYALTEKLSLNGFASYRRLVGDAGRSPVVRQGGSSNQFMAGFGIGYRF